MPAGSLGRLRDRSAAALALAVFRTGLPALKQAAGTADVSCRSSCSSSR
jgi:hypothetical protein